MELLGLLLLLLPGPWGARTPQEPTLESVVELRWVPGMGHIEASLGDGSLLRFDHRLRLLEHLDRVPDTRPKAPQGCVATGRGDQPLQVRGPAGRALHWDPAAAALRLGVAPFEEPASVQWGPGWARIGLRSQDGIGPTLEWQDARGSHLARVIRDPRDPLRQRAWLRGLQVGSEVRIRLRHPERRYPPQRWGPWRVLVVPEVTPAGARPEQLLLTSGLQ